jgi:hypothetical protein
MEKNTVTKFWREMENRRLEVLRGIAEELADAARWALKHTFHQTTCASRNEEFAPCNCGVEHTIQRLELVISKHEQGWGV